MLCEDVLNVESLNILRDVMVTILIMKNKAPKHIGFEALLVFEKNTNSFVV